ncbi:galactose oxidase early set domain-containing protein [Streptomyces sp. NPDC020096]
MSKKRLAAVMSACAVISALTTTTALTNPVSASARTAPAPAARKAALPGMFSARRVQAEVRPEEVAALGQDQAKALAWARLVARATQDDYPQSTRTASLRRLTRSQRKANANFDPSEFGVFRKYFQSPDFGDHIALLPTGKVLVFSFERIETNPTKEPAPTNTIGADNAGRAWLWDPSKGYGTSAFKKVTPPTVDMPDGTDSPRPAPFFCAGHAYLPNGMLGVFGGNLGGKGGSGAKLALVFNPWDEQWYLNKDMSVGRWYPSVVTGADGRQLIFSGQSENGWGTPTPVVERFPAQRFRLPVNKTDIPQDWAADRFKEDAPFTTDYPHLFSLRDGKIYALGRDASQQWLFDPVKQTRTDLPPRPDGMSRNYGSAVALPGGYRGPNSVLVLGGDRDNPNTYKLSGGKWTIEKPRAFGRTQDDTLVLPDGTLLTVNGAHDIRDYGNGEYNPNADLKYRQIELRDAQGNWKLGPVQRLPRGYHSNAVILPDGRIMITGDELQQLANDPDINDDMNGSIEIYEPAYLHRGARPKLDSVSETSLAYDAEFKVTTSTPSDVERAVLVAPITSTHSVDTSQRQLDLQITKRDGGTFTLEAPPQAEAAPPGYYMLFLLNARGVPSMAKWVQLNPDGEMG